MHLSRKRAIYVLVLVLTVSLTFSSPVVAAPGKCEVFAIFDPVCEAGKTVAVKAGGIITAPVRYAAGSAVEMITAWVADSAQWLLAKVVNFIDDSTSPDLGAAWFTERYSFMIGLATLVLLPMLLIAAIRAVVQQDMSQLTRSFFVYLPTAALGTFIAVFLTQTLLAATDALSAAVGEGIAGDVSEIFDSIGRTLGPTGPAAPSFAIFFGALLLIIGAFLVWLELLVRSAAVTVSVFFLPLILAGLVWPATARWTKRLIETLVALILSKFVIVSVISLATAALAQPGTGGFAAVMGGAALMLMAAFSPLALLKLVPLVEGAAVAHLEGMGRRPLDTARPGGSVNHAVSIMRSKIAPAGATPQMAIASSGAGAGAAGTTSAAGGAAAAGLGVARAAERGAQEPGKRLEGRIDTATSTPQTTTPSSRVGGRPDTGARVKPPRPETPGPETNKGR